MTETTRDPVHRARYSFQSEGENLIVETWLEPGGKLPPHLHPHQEERWSVVDGEVRIQRGKEKRVIGPADGEVIMQPGVEHGLESSSDREAHLSCLVLPALDLQDFLEDSAAAARKGYFTVGGIPRSLEGARWAANFLKQHRENVVMSSPPRFLQSALIALLGRDQLTRKPT